MYNLNEKYKKLNKNIERIDGNIPSAFIPSPVQQNYLDGYITRYFLQRRGDNDNTIFEVSEDFYRKINFPYKGVFIKWHIVGSLEDKYDGNTLTPSVINLNKKEIQKVVKEMPTLKLYLVNLKQFWKPL